MFHFIIHLRFSFVKLSSFCTVVAKKTEHMTVTLKNEASSFLPVLPGNRYFQLRPCFLKIGAGMEGHSTLAWHFQFCISHSVVFISGSLDNWLLTLTPFTLTRAAKYDDCDVGEGVSRSGTEHYNVLTSFRNDVSVSGMLCGDALVWGAINLYGKITIKSEILP